MIFDYLNIKRISIFHLLVCAIGLYLINIDLPTYIILIIICAITLCLDIVKFLPQYLKLIKAKLTLQKSVKILDTTYFIEDIIWFKEPIIHPYTKEKIYNGRIINIKDMIIQLYLADKTDIVGGYCDSWIKKYSIDELEKVATPSS